ncbi:unnamed protein product [Symbiodinium sp. CCMP2592]|nr:unnamed protein product [Symbiodinium sp. CCMP2592]
MDAPSPIADVSTGMNLEQLGDAISLGTFFVQGQQWLVMAGFLALLWLALLTFSQCRQNLAHSRALTGIMQALVDLQAHVSGMPSIVPGTDSEVVSALQCLDAKMLQLCKDNQELQSFVLDLQKSRTLETMETTMQQIAGVAESTGQLMEQWTKEVPPRIKEIYGFVSAIPRLEKAVSANALDTAKSFVLQETLSDGLPKQGRESLHYLQGEQRAQSEKLTEVKQTTEELRSTLKQTNVDLHVAKTRSEQKLDSIQKDVQSLQGATQSAFRGLNVLVPSSKTLQDNITNVLDYLVKANQAASKAAEDMLALQEIAGNTDTRAYKLEALVGGLQDSLGEMQDIVMQILDRTPKIMKRNPPSDQPSSSQPATPPPQPTTTEPPPMPQPHQQPPPTGCGSQPLRLSEHLQPLTAGQAPIYMMGDPLRAVSTSDLLRTLMARGNF